MTMNFEITPENFLLYAAKHYDNPSCSSMKEFQDDLKRFKYIKRLLKRYKKTQIVSERLVLNHIILLHNVFKDAVVPMLFFKLEQDYWSELKTFLVYLKYVPNTYKINNTVEISNIPLDQTIVNTLRKI